MCRPYLFLFSFLSFCYEVFKSFIFFFIFRFLCLLNFFIPFVFLFVTSFFFLYRLNLFLLFCFLFFFMCFAWSFSFFSIFVICCVLYPLNLLLFPFFLFDMRCIVSSKYFSPFSRGVLCRLNLFSLSFSFYKVFYFV